MSHPLPVEVQEFEQLLQKPNSDPTGFAGYFNSGEIWVARVPARLDVIGGIADYSGANVCEGVLGRGMLMALQPRTDSTLRIRTVQVMGGGGGSLCRLRRGFRCRIWHRVMDWRVMGRCGNCAMRILWSDGRLILAGAFLRC